MTVLVARLCPSGVGLVNSFTIFVANSLFVWQALASNYDGLIWGRVGALLSEALKKSPQLHGSPLNRA